MLSSIMELHSYLDRTQLTQELGGTQEYCHDKWISHRTVSVHASHAILYDEVKMSTDIIVCVRLLKVLP